MSVDLVQDPDLEDAMGADLLLDLPDAAGGQELAPLDDPDRRAEVGQLGEDVAGDQDRLAHLAQFVEQRLHLEPGPGIQARRGLVEDEHRGIMDERLGQAEPLLHPLGEPVDVIVSLVGQVEQVEHFADDLLAVRTGDLVGDGEEVEELPDFHAVVDAEIVGHEADDPPDRHRLGGDRVARDAPLAERRPQQGGQESDRGALAGAVGPDEAEDLALTDGEAQVVDGDEITVILREVDHLDHDSFVSMARPARRGAVIGTSGFESLGQGSPRGAAAATLVLVAGRRGAAEPGPRIRSARPSSTSGLWAAAGPFSGPIARML